jgi:hypothetical protein
LTVDKGFVDAQIGKQLGPSSSGFAQLIVVVRDTAVGEYPGIAVDPWVAAAVRKGAMNFSWSERASGFSLQRTYFHEFPRFSDRFAWQVS